MAIAPGAILPAHQCRELGRRWYADRLNPEWQPKTAAVMRRIFDDVGLRGAFWDV